MRMLAGDKGPKCSAFSCKGESQLQEHLFATCVISGSRGSARDLCYNQDKIFMTKSLSYEAVHWGCLLRKPPIYSIFEGILIQVLGTEAITHLT